MTGVSVNHGFPGLVVAPWSGSFWIGPSLGRSHGGQKGMKDLLEGAVQCQCDRSPSPPTLPSGDTGPLGPHPSQIAALPKFPLQAHQ